MEMVLISSEIQKYPYHNIIHLSLLYKKDTYKIYFCEFKHYIHFPPLIRICLKLLSLNKLVFVYFLSVIQIKLIQTFILSFVLQN